MAPRRSTDNNALESINNIIRGLSLAGILWVVNTTNTTDKNLLLLTNDVGHVKENQRKLKADVLSRMADRFTGTDGKRLESEIKEVEKKLEKHKERETH